MNTDIRPQPYSLRIEPEIRAKLEAAAKAGNRSLHAEIMMRLETSLTGNEPKQTVSDDIVQMMRQIARETALELIREELAKARN
jgi:hypothetical protein